MAEFAFNSGRVEILLDSVLDQWHLKDLVHCRSASGIHIQELLHQGLEVLAVHGWHRVVSTLQNL